MRFHSTWLPWRSRGLFGLETRWTLWQVIDSMWQNCQLMAQFFEGCLFLELLSNNMHDNDVHYWKQSLNIAITEVSFFSVSVLLFISIFVINFIKIALNSLSKISCWFTTILIMFLRDRSPWKREQRERIISRQEINRPVESFSYMIKENFGFLSSYKIINLLW